MTDTTYQFYWQDRSVRRSFKTGVSLHSHTMCSEESLEMIPRYTARVPYLGQAIRHHQAEYAGENGDHLDFRRAYWTPPSTPREAYRLEEKQVEHSLQLPALVSLTDHDNIHAGMRLQVLERFAAAPVSTEWSIPFGPTFFHLGVHNLPVQHAAGMMAYLREYTRAPADDALGGFLQELNSYPDVLLVLNHPFWDEKGIGSSEHAHILGRLMERYGTSIHALEVNGLRSWKENKQVVWLGRQSGLPVVSGGDRHGLEPNAVLNLSAAETLVDFIHEVRYRRRSHVLFMPQYQEPLRLRLLQTMVDVVREYPRNFEGRRTWADRVFFRSENGTSARPLSSIWTNGGPLVVKRFVAAMRLLEFKGVRAALRVALNDRVSVWSESGAAMLP